VGENKHKQTMSGRWNSFKMRERPERGGPGGDAAGNFEALGRGEEPEYRGKKLGM